MTFHYVYILQSVFNQDRFYIGITDDLRTRLKKHNGGQVAYTAQFRPWKINTAIAFSSKKKADAFERYLKTASGRAFARKRL
jgi:putative endonuclease